MASWQKSGNILFEKVEITDTQNIAVEIDSILSLSRFGGPIAKYNPSDVSVQVFAGGGRIIGQWKSPSKLCSGGIGWTEDLVLVFVLEDDQGTVFVWDDFVLPASKPRKLRLSFGQPIKMVHFWNDSIIGLTARMSVIVIKDVRHSPRVKWAPVVFPIVAQPRALCVLRPFASTLTDATLEIVVALPDQAGMLVACPDRKSVDARVPQFRALPSRFLVPHPTQSILASLDVSNRLLIVNTMWDEILYARDCDLGAEIEVAPASLSWCMGGSGHSVVLLWEKAPWSQRAAQNAAESLAQDQVRDDDVNVAYGPGALVLGFLPNSASAAASLMEGNGGEFSSAAASQSVARFAIDAFGARVFSISEIDGLRVMCFSQMPHVKQPVYIIRRVSHATQAVDAIGSLSPAALLLESSSDDLLLASMLDEDLISGADDLMDCAKFELNFSRKLEMLRASQRGKDRISSEERIVEKAQLSRKFAHLCQFTQAFQYLLDGKITSATPMQVFCIGLTVFACRVAALGFAEEAMLFARSCQLPLQPYALVQARKVTAQPASTMMNGKSNEFTRISRMIFKSASFPRSDCSAALSLCLEPNHDLSLRISEFESRFNRRIICLLRLNEIDRVLSLLDTSRGVDFEIKARTALYCRNAPSELNATVQKDSTSAVTPVPQDLRIAAHPITEQALRATYRSMKDAVKLEKWLIYITSNKSLALEKRSKASQERALLLLEMAMFVPEYSLDFKKKGVLLQESAKEFDSAGKSFFASQTRDYSSLTNLQNEVSMPLGKSVAQTVVDCVARGRDDLADRFRKQFNLKPSLFWTAKVRGMGKRGLWLEAARMLILEKEAGRWVKVEDVLEMCFEQGAESSAAKIAFELLEDGNPEKARAFVKLRMWQEALKFSSKSRCLDAAQEIAIKCRDVEITSRANELLQDIRKNPTTMEGSGNASEGGILGFVSGAVKGEPQRCQQQ